MTDDTRPLLGNGPLRRAFGKQPEPDTESDEIENVTIGDLKEEYGEKAVIRGLKYMASLSNADESYRDSANKQLYVERMQEAYGVDDKELSEQAQKASDEWEERMKNGGLGLDDG